MKNHALISLKDKSKKLKHRLLQFLFDALRVKIQSASVNSNNNSTGMANMAPVKSLWVIWSSRPDGLKVQKNLVQAQGE